MLIEPKTFASSCSCGRRHALFTQTIVVESGCLQSLDSYAQKAGLTGVRAAIYDTNTYNAKGLIRPRADQEIVLDAANLHATEHAVDKVLSLVRCPDVLIAVGSGTVHDIVRYCAAKLKIPFISVPTAASVDGFASTVAAMTWHGYKLTFPAVAPIIILADLDIISKAPFYLTVSGVGDMLGKHISLAEWRIAHLLTGEYYCEYIASLTKKAVDSVQESCPNLKKGDSSAYEQLTYGLILSGLAMQLAGNSRPASGAEHHISHCWELAVINKPSPALHGEKVAVGTLLCAGIYHKLEEINDISGMVKDTAPFDEGLVRANFGELAEDILKENDPDCMADITGTFLAENWQGVRKILFDVPSKAVLEKLLKDLGAKITAEDLELPGSIVAQTIELSPYVRNRLTLMRMGRLFKVPFSSFL